MDHPRISDDDATEKGIARRGCLAGESFTEELYGFGGANGSYGHMKRLYYLTQCRHISWLRGDWEYIKYHGWISRIQCVLQLRQLIWVLLKIDDGLLLFFGDLLLYWWYMPRILGRRCWTPTNLSCKEVTWKAAKQEQSMSGIDLKELTQDSAWSLEVNGEQGRWQEGEHDAINGNQCMMQAVTADVQATEEHVLQMSWLVELEPPKTAWIVWLEMFCTIDCFSRYWWMIRHSSPTVPAKTSNIISSAQSDKQVDVEIPSFEFPVFSPKSTNTVPISSTISTALTSASGKELQGGSVHFRLLLHQTISSAHAILLSLLYIPPPRKFHSHPTRWLQSACADDLRWRSRLGACSSSTNPRLL